MKKELCKNIKKGFCLLLALVTVVTSVLSNSEPVSAYSCYLLYAPKSFTIQVGDKCCLTDYCSYYDYNLKVKNYNNFVEATFKSSKKSIASVDKKGILSAKKVGKAKVTISKGGRNVTTTINVVKKGSIKNYLSDSTRKEINNYIKVIDKYIKKKTSTNYINVVFEYFKLYNDLLKNYDFKDFGNDYNTCKIEDFKKNIDCELLKAINIKNGNVICLFSSSKSLDYNNLDVHSVRSFKFVNKKVKVDSNGSFTIKLKNKISLVDLLNYAIFDDRLNENNASVCEDFENINRTTKAITIYVPVYTDSQPTDLYAMLNINLNSKTINGQLVWNFYGEPITEKHMTLPNKKKITILDDYITLVK